MGSKGRRHVIMPIEEDPRFTVEGDITTGYVRVQNLESDFFIPGTLFRRAALSLRPKAHIEGRSIKIERLSDTEGGAKCFRFTVRTLAGETKTCTITGLTVDEIVERIDQVKAVLHSYSYEDPGASAPLADTPDSTSTEVSAS